MSTIPPPPAATVEKKPDNPEAAPASSEGTSPGRKPSHRKLAVNRHVNYVLPHQSPFAGEIRPAVVTKVYNDHTCNLSVLKALGSDFSGVEGVAAGAAADSAVALICSVHEGDEDEPGTWHWPIFD